MLERRRRDRRSAICDPPHRRGVGLNCAERLAQHADHRRDEDHRVDTAPLYCRQGFTGVEAGQEHVRSPDEGDAEEHGCGGQMEERRRVEHARAIGIRGAGVQHQTGRHEVAVAQHDALVPPCRSAGEEDRRYVVPTSAMVRNRGFSGDQVVDALFAMVSVQQDHIDAFGREVGGVGEESRVDQHHPWTAIGGRIQYLGSCPAGVERHENRACPGYAVDRLGIAIAVERENAHAIPGRDAATPKPRREFCDAFGEFPPIMLTIAIYRRRAGRHVVPAPPKGLRQLHPLTPPGRESAARPSRDGRGDGAALWKATGAPRD